MLLLADGDQRYLHVLTHSFPTRRSSDLVTGLEVTEVDPPAPCLRGGEGQVAAVRRYGRWRLGHQPEIKGKRQVDVQRCGERFARSDEHTSELQSLMRSSYAVFCLNKKREGKPAESRKHPEI